VIVKKETIDKPEKTVYNKHNTQKGNGEFTLLASFRNFFITFVLALALFGGLAYHYYGDLAALLPGAEADTESEGEVSAEQSDEVSDESSGGGVQIGLVDKGDDLGMLNGLIVTKSEKGEVLSARFVRINSEKRMVITCSLSLGAVVYNEVSATVPLRDYLRIYSGEQAAAVICSLTGYSADFYLELTPDALDEMVAWMIDPHFALLRELKHVNPIYAELELEPGAALPSDYYKLIPAGNLTLTEKTIATLREHYSVCDGTEDGHEAYEMVLAGLYDSLLTQLFTEQKDAMLADPARMATLLSGAETNLNVDFLQEKVEILMKYKDSENYETVEIPYTTRDDTIYRIKMADK